MRDLSHTADNVKALINIDPGHPIFNGHFPGQPIVPGVCMMQMVKEIVETVTGKRTNVGHVQEMKFLALIDPVKNNLIDAELQYAIDDKGSIQVSASLSGAGVLHFKFKGQLDFL